MKHLCFLMILAGSYLPLHAQSQSDVYAELERHYNEEAFEACVGMARKVEAFVHNRLDTLAANSLFYLGDAYNQMGETKKALHYFELEKKTRESLKLDGTNDFSNTLNNLAYLYLQNGDYAKAGAIADRLIANDRMLFAPTADEYVSSVVYVSDIYIQLDRIKDAEQLLLNTLKAQGKKTINRGVLLNKLGDLYSYSGQYSRASRILTEAIDLLAEEAGEESAEFISTAINMGILFMSQGKYPEAEEIFEVALTKVDDTEPAYASVLNNQALVFQSLGQLQRAENTLQNIRKRDSIELGATHPNYAITLSNLGLVYIDQSKYEQAERVLQTALTIQKENREATTISYATKLNNLAKVYQMSGSPKRAIPLLEEAMSIFRKNMGKESPEYATAVFNLGLALWKSGSDEPGYKYLRLSAAIRAKSLGKNHPKYAESILKIAEYQWQKQSIRDAEKSFGEVFDNYFFQIDETFPVLTEEEKSKFYYTNIRPSFDKFNSFAVQHRNQAPSLLQHAYNYLVNTKAAIMFATEKVRTAILSSGDQELIAQFEKWQSTKEQIAKLYSLNQEHPGLDSLLTASDAMEKELARRSAEFSNQFEKKRIQYEDIQNRLKPGEAAIEVLRFQQYNPAAGGTFYKETHYGFLILTSGSNSQPELVMMPNGDDMETKFLRYYRNNIKYNLRDAASYEHYFAPLADYLKKRNVNRIYFSADGVYNQININSIENPATKKYLIDELDIRFVTNTRELVEQPAPKNSNQSSMLMGFPKFNLDAGELPAAGKGPVTRGNRAWRGGLLRYMHADEGITVLPGTQIEIQQIAKLLGDGTTVHMENEASERVAKTVSNPRVLHIATHGYFLEDEAVAGNEQQNYFSNPLLNAGLMLAGAENFLKTGSPINDHGDDGILTAFEAMNLKLDETQLVVLSACETALGDVQNGEGVYGLQRALKLAGAGSIVMSLWNVDDEATQQLMSAFYEEMLRNGDQHEAFRAAQQKVKEKYPSPFYWGAFVMVGI